MEYKKLLLELLHRTEAISMTLQEILSENNLNTALEHLNKKRESRELIKCLWMHFPNTGTKTKILLNKNLKTEHTNQDLLWHALLQNREKMRKEN